MDFLISVLAFVFALGVIIFVHEAGHLIVARAFDVRVLTFSLGFGKRLWGFKRGDTDYRVSLIPLGGYVKMSGELPEEATGDPRDFLSRPRWQRVLVYLAGPAMNVVLAVLLFWIVFMVGIDIPNATKLPPVVGAVFQESPAEAAGFEEGDRIVSIDGKPVRNWEEVHMTVLFAPEKTLRISYLRGEGESREDRTAELTPERVGREELGFAGWIPPGRVQVRSVLPGQPAEAGGIEVGDEIVAVAGRPLADREELIAYIQDHPGEQLELGLLRGGTRITRTVVPQGAAGSALIGVELGFSYKRRYPPGQAFIESLHYNVYNVRQIGMVLGKIFTREVAAKSALSGPIDIFVISGEQAQLGFNYLLHLMGLLSISIALINLLPIPVLDGGQIFILLIEMVMRRDLSLSFKERLAQVGFLIIIALMLTVIVFDLQKRLPPGLLPGS